MRRPGLLDASRRLPVIVLALVGAGLVGTLVFVDGAMRGAARRRAGAEIEAVSALRARAVASFRDEHERRAASAADAPAVRWAVAGPAPLAGALAGQALEVLGRLGAVERYVRIALLDALGRPRLVWSPPGAADHPFEPDLASEVQETRRPAHRIHLHDDRAWPLLDLAVAVAATRPGAPGGVLAVRVPLDLLLADLLSGWPVPSETGTSLLALPDPGGTGVLVLGPPDWLGRERRMATVPRSDALHPAVLAAAGASGVFHAVDLRKDEVLTAARAVPGTAWNLLSKKSLAEVDAPLAWPLGIIAALGTLLLLAGGAMLGLWWRQEDRRAEALVLLEHAERMASLGRLAAGVAHEINNPLAAVVGNLEVLKAHLATGQAGGDAERGEALADALEAAGRVRDVVRSLRGFSRADPDRRVPVALRGEIEAALRMAQNELRHRARLEVRLGDLPDVVSREHELGQVFLNLLVNAAQAIPDGQAERHLVTVEGGRDADGWARVEVIDTGVGMPPEVVARAFDPFFTTKPAESGTGLGLAIARSIVTQAGGRIEVESRMGQGTRFRVLLPPAPAPAAAPASLAQAPAPAAAARREPAARAPAAAVATRRQVLVVDDEPLVARVAARILEQDAAVTVAGSGQEALDLLAGGARFDAILCDLMMPHLSGMDLQERVRAEYPDQARRMIFVTGGAFTARTQAFLERPDVVWIEKPFVPERLRAAVERAATAPTR